MKAAELRDEDVAKLVKGIRDRVIRALRRLGKWGEEADVEELTGGQPGEQLPLQLGSPAAPGSTASGFGWPLRPAPR